MNRVSRLLRNLRRTLGRLRQARGVIRLVVYDTFRFILHAPIGRIASTQGQHDAIITHDYHALEKGLSMPNSRAGFGKKYLLSTARAVATATTRFGWSHASRVAVRVLQQYEEAHPEGISVSEVERFIRANRTEAGQEGGVREVYRRDILEHGNKDLKEFFASRHSVRDFSPTPVELGVVFDAIQDAVRTPSVCNRQPWHVYVVQRPETIARALSFQNGNRGFGDRIQVLMIVVADLEAFLSPRERFQPWIDGGMFSMSLVYALHARGLGTCCLNMCSSAANDLKLRQSLAIRPHHSVVMMIAIGNMPDRFKITASPRRGADGVVTLLE